MTDHSVHYRNSCYQSLLLVPPTLHKAALQDTHTDEPPIRIIHTCTCKCMGIGWYVNNLNMPNYQSM